MACDTMDSMPAAAAKLPLAAGTSPFAIKGAGYCGVVRLVARKVRGGFVALARALDDAELLAFVRQPFHPARRYDVLPMLPINAAIARVMGKPLEILAAEQGIAQACHDIQYAYRRMFETTTLEALHKSVPRLADPYFDFGQCTADRVGAGHLVVRRRRVPEYVLPWFAPAQTSYLEEFVRWKGARVVRATLLPPASAGVQDGLTLVDLATEVRWA